MNTKKSQITKLPILIVIGIGFVLGFSSFALSLNFEPVQNLSASVGDSVHHRIVVSGSNVHVVWADSTPGNYADEVFFRRSTDGGATFEAVQNLSSSAVVFSNFPKVAAEGSAIFVVWTEWTHVPTVPGDILLRTSTDGGATFDPAEDLSSNFGFSIGPEIAVQMPNIFVAWMDDTPGNVDILFRRGIIEQTMEPSLKLAFPLKGTKPGRNENLGPNNASINSVFDHTMKNQKGQYTIYKKDGNVTAFTNETGQKKIGSGRGEFSDCYNQSSGLPFNITGNYTGPRSLGSKYLCYDGHPGYDYRADMKTEVYAVADGTINYPKTIVGVKQNSAYNKLHVLELIPDNFSNYKIYFLHLFTHPSTKKKVTINDSTLGCPSPVTLPLPNGTHVKKGCLIALSGDAGSQKQPHLHFEVQKVLPLSEVKEDARAIVKCVDIPDKACVPVDPYGWDSSALDPYFNLTNVTNVRLWK